MARTAPRLKTSLIRQRDACRAMGICRVTFWRHWGPVFTDPRDPTDRGTTCHRNVFEDELAVAVEAGGGVSGRAKAAVINYRASVGRKS
ncbi:hypothetical protein [Gemmata sp.]|uniref:hypothetical protein n=1 Tax=Gemmata sp. TaxID=1914242 RepID=UPI003F71FFD0